jgi:hypothetical protein
MTLVLLFRPAAGQREPRFSSQGNLLPVPTLVRDASGNAVYGLHAQDFIVGRQWGRAGGSSGRTGKD